MLKYLQINQIKGNEKNPRIIRAEDLDRLKRDILDDPEFLNHSPLKGYTDTDGKVKLIGGNMRFKAIQEIWGQLEEKGLTGIPVSVFEDSEIKDKDGNIDEKKLTKRIFIDNESYGKYDIDLLSQHFDLEDLAEFDLPQLNSILDTIIPESDLEIAEYEMPRSDFEIISQVGDLYELKAEKHTHRLKHGDSTLVGDIEALVGKKEIKNFFNLVVTDPPYNIGYESNNGVKHKKIKNDKMTHSKFKQFLLDIVTNIKLCLDGAFYIYMSELELHLLRQAIDEAGMKWLGYIIWVKTQFTLGGSDYQHQFEPMAYGFSDTDTRKITKSDLEDDSEYASDYIFYGKTDKKTWKGGRKQSNVWVSDKPTISDLHPTMKPVKLIARSIANSSKVNSNVLDLFGGSGSTLIACEQLARNAYLMEFELKYVDIIVARYCKYMSDNNRPFSLIRNGIDISEKKQDFLSLITNARGL